MGADTGSIEKATTYIKGYIEVIPGRDLDFVVNRYFKELSQSEYSWLGFHEIIKDQGRPQLLISLIEKSSRQSPDLTAQRENAIGSLGGLQDAVGGFISIQQIVRPSDVTSYGARILIEDKFQGTAGVKGLRLLWEGNI